MYNKTMIIQYFRRFFYIFNDYKKAFFKYSCLSLFVAILELFGVALTYPFVIKLLSNTTPNKTYYETFFLGIIIILLFLLKNVCMIIFSYLQCKFITKFEIAIKKRIMNFFLNADYKITSKITLAEKNKIFNYLLLNILQNFIIRFLNLNVNLLIFIFIVAFIAIKFPLATFASILCAVLLIGMQTYIFKPILTKTSKIVSQLGLINNKTYNDAIMNIKSIKISGNERYFYDNFSKSLTEFANKNLNINFMTSAPPYIIEPFAIILLFVLLLVISYQNYTSPDKLIASFAIIATAIFRITPSISRIQVNLNGINSTLPLVKELFDIYEKYNIKNIQEIKNKSYETFYNDIKLKNIYFEYEPNNKILKDINLTINKGEFIGIVGLSGVGKTTLVDIIAGLYKPTSGDILIDNKPYSNNLKIGYIPQEFCLINGDIRENVAFGHSVIDDTRVIDALKKAQLYDFIKDNYANGIYENPFSDANGMSLGQKQRMAIARAIYSNPDILILDEATSSLDLKTESEICNVLNSLRGDKTIIVIAHRLSTIKTADKIAFMENGSITNIGTFEELIKNSKTFEELVQHSFKQK